MPEPALQLREVCAGYADTVVLEAIDFTLQPGEAVSVIGRNGVGKSTLLATIMGHTTLRSGKIELFGADIGGLHTYERVWKGLAYVPQEREIFKSLTVLENLQVAARGGGGLEATFELFPSLYERRTHYGSQLSGGEQQMLAIARALAGNPSVLLMDEPSEGLAPIIVELLQTTLWQLRDESSIAMVLVEQNSRLALSFAERCVVMNRGRIVRDGPSQALREDDDLLHRLIGVDASESPRDRHVSQE